MARQGVVSVLCAANLAVFGAAVMQAHEIGTTRVSVLLQPDRTYQIEIVTDATALIEKLGRPGLKNQAN